APPWPQLPHRAPRRVHRDRRLVDRVRVKEVMSPSASTLVLPAAFPQAVFGVAPMTGGSRRVKKQGAVEGFEARSPHMTDASHRLSDPRGSSPRAHRS